MSWWESAGSREWTVLTVIYAFFSAQKVKYEGRTGSLRLHCLPVEKQLRASRLCIAVSIWSTWNGFHSPKHLTELLEFIWVFLPYAFFCFTVPSSYLRRAYSPPSIHLVFSGKKKKKVCNSIYSFCPDLVFIDQSAVWPKCGPGLPGSCLLVQSGKCTESTSQTAPCKIALNGTQKTLRSWLSHLFFSDWAEIIFICMFEQKS